MEQRLTRTGRARRSTEWAKVFPRRFSSCINCTLLNIAASLPNLGRLTTNFRHAIIRQCQHQPSPIIPGHFDLRPVAMIMDAKYSAFHANRNWVGMR